MLLCPMLSLQRGRDAELQKQLLLKDRDGMTLAMHAAKAGNCSVLESVLEDIKCAQVRGILRSRS